jgi:hypothetical protein
LVNTDFTIGLTGSATAGTVSETPTDGTYTTDIDNIEAETVTVTVTANGVTLTDTPAITYTAAAAASLDIQSGNGQSGTVGQALADPFEVIVSDEFGNPVEGESVNFAIDQVPPGASGQSLSTTSVLTDEFGRASTVLTLGDTPGTYTVDASSGSLTAVTFSAEAEIGAPSQMTVSVQPSETTAGEVITPAPAVTVTDDAGNGVQGVNVTVSEQGGYIFDAGLLTITTDASGTAAFTDLMIETANTYQLIFNADASGVSNESSNPFDVVAAAGDASNTTADVPNGAAGNTTTITITVEDQFDNPVTGEAGNLSVTVSGANSAAPSVSETGTAGEYTASYTPTTAGEDEIAISLSDAAIVGSPFTSNVTTSDVSASNSSVTADPATLQVGNSSIVTIELRDGSNNPIGGLTGSDFNINVSGNGSAGSVSETSQGNYQFNVNNTTAQQVTVTVTAQGVTLDEKPAITFEAGDVDIVAIQTQPGETVAGETIAGPPRVRLLDEFGNRVPGIDVTVSEQGGEAFASGTLTVVSNSSGEATFDNLVINRADSYNLVFTASGKTVTSNAFGVIPATADPAQTTATVPNGSAGDVTDITMTVRDAFDNRVDGVAGSLSAAVTSGPNSGASFTTISSSGNGVYTTGYTPETTGDDIITITLDGTGISGTPFTSTVITSDADDVSVEQQPLQTVAGQAIAGPPSVLVTDNLANPVEGVEVNVTIQGGQEFDGGTTSHFTNSSGIAVFNDLVINEANDYRLIFNAIGVTDNALSDLFDVLPAAASGTVIVSGNNQSGTVTEQLTDLFVIRVEDAFGNPVSGHDIEFAIDDTPGGSTGQTLSVTNTTTDATGEASTQLTLGNRPGTYTVNAGAGAAGLVVFTATAEPGAADSFVFNTIASPQTAAQLFGITIEAQDQFENLATGYSGSADLTTTAGTITPSTASFSSGQVTLDVSVSETGTDQTITATDGTVTGTSNTFDVEAGGVDAGNSSVTVDPANLQAGNPSTLTIELLDGSNNPVSGLVNTDFTIGLTGSATAGTVSETPTDGTYTTDIDNIEAETVTVTVTANGVTLTDTPAITYTAAAAASLDIQSGNGQLGIVGQALSDPFEVTVSDEFGNPVEGESVNFAIDQVPPGASGQSLSTTSVLTDEFGRASTVLTLGDTPGTYTVDASSGSLTAVTFSAEAEIGAPSQMTVSVQPSETTAGEVITPAPAVTVTDDAGNGVQGVNVTVSEQGGYIFDAGLLTITTDASGTAAFTDLMIETANTYQLIFNADASGVSNESSNPFDVVAAAGDASNTTADVPNGAAGESTSIIITVLDSFNNRVTGAADDLSAGVINGPNAGAAFTAITDNGNGTYSTSYTPETIGTDEISITLNTIGISGSPYSSDVTTSDVSASNSSVTANPITLQAGSESEVTVEVRDGSNNPISGLVSGDFNISVSSSGTADTITESATAGTYTFNVTNSVAEEVTVTVTATGTTLEDTPVINFTAADPDLMLITTEPETSVAGEPIEGPPAVRITDEFSNPVPNISVTVTEQGGATFSTGSTENLNTDAFGFAIFDNLSIETAGQYNLVFSVAGVSNRTSNAFNVDPAGVSASVSGVSTTSPHTADGTDASTVTITLADGFGNEITGLGNAAFGVDVGVNASAGLVSETATDGTYEFAVTNTTIETVMVVITADGVTLDEQPTIEFQAGAASEMSITQQPTSAVAGEAIAPAPSVEVTDGTNPVSGVDVTAILSNNDFTATSTVVVATDGSGIAAFTNLVIETAATGYTITFDADAAGVADVTSASFDIDSGSATQISSLTIADAEIALNGSTSVTATVLDANNNPVEGVSVSFDSNESDRATVTSPVLTNASGQAAATVTGANSEAGEVVITASISDTDGNVAASDSETVGLTVLAGAADASQSDIGADPTSGLTADGVESSTLTITVRDGSGNLLADEDVFFDITNGTGGTLSAGPWSSDVNGQATATLTSVDANTITVTGYLGTDASGSVVGTADVAFVAGAPASVTAAATVGSAAADGSDELVFQITVEDADENPVSGMTVTAGDNGSGITYTGGGDSQTTDVNGEVTFTVVSSTVQSDVTFIFTEAVSSTSDTATGSFTDSSGFTVADPGGQTSGEVFNLELSNAQGIDGELLEGSINVTVSSNLDGEVQNTGISFSGGSATVPVTLSTANDHTLTVNVSGVTDNQTVVVTVAAGG